MPIYKNRLQMPDDTVVRHYTTLDAVVSILKARRLRITRVDKFGDIFEGSVPKKQMDDQDLLLSSAEARRMMMNSVAAHYPGMPISEPMYRDPWDVMTQRRRAMTRSAYASCWSWGDESEAMWRLYCSKDRLRPQGEGVVLCTTMAKLEAFVAQHNLYVGAIRYRYYHEGDAFNDELVPLMHKRKGFEREQEVRLLFYDQQQYFALTRHLHIVLNNTTDRVAPVNAIAEPPSYVDIDWNLADAIDEITVSPYADAEYELTAKDVIAAINPSLAEHVKLSVLSERRYPPHF